MGGYHLRLDPGDDNDRLTYFDMVGHAYTRLVRQLVRAGDCVVDVGANVGHFSAVCAEQVGPGPAVSTPSKPHAPLFERLRESSSERPAGPIKVHHFAVSSKAGRVAFYLATNCGWSSLVENETFTTAERVVVPAMTLDQFLSSADIRHIRLLKLDIEGGETDALLGARQTLGAGKVDLVLLEAEPKRLQAFGHTGLEIAHLMAEHGFVPVAYVIVDDIRPVTPALSVPGSFNGDYLYARQKLSGAVRQALSGEFPR